MTENKIVRLCLFIMLALGGKTFGCAQTGEEVRKHVIIAIDTRPNGFADTLHDSIFMTRKVTEILSGILCDSDYVSVIDYGMPLNAQSFDEFTTCTV